VRKKNSHHFAQEKWSFSQDTINGGRTIEAKST
jgi:hypothetical protein